MTVELKAVVIKQCHFGIIPLAEDFHCQTKSPDTGTLFDALQFGIQLDKRLWTFRN